MSFAAFMPRNVVHSFTLTAVSDVDDEFCSYLDEAYRVGRQERPTR